MKQGMKAWTCGYSGVRESNECRLIKQPVLSSNLLPCSSTTTHPCLIIQTKNKRCIDNQTSSSCSHDKSKVHIITQCNDTMIYHVLKRYASLVECVSLFLIMKRAASINGKKNRGHFTTKYSQKIHLYFDFSCSFFPFTFLTASSKFSSFSAASNLWIIRSSQIDVVRSTAGPWGMGLDR